MKWEDPLLFRIFWGRRYKKAYGIHNYAAFWFHQAKYKSMLKNMFRSQFLDKQISVISLCSERADTFFKSHKLLKIFLLSVTTNNVLNLFKRLNKCIYFKTPEFLSHYSKWKAVNFVSCQVNIIFNWSTQINLKALKINEMIEKWNGRSIHLVLEIHQNV